MTKPYRVSFGYYGERFEDFHVFSDAWAFHAAKPGSVLTHMERYDGCEDGNESGLSEAERESVGLP